MARQKAARDAVVSQLTAPGARRTIRMSLPLSAANAGIGPSADARAASASDHLRRDLLSDLIRMLPPLPAIFPDWAAVASPHLLGLNQESRSMARLKHFLSVMNMGVQLGAPQGPCRHTRRRLTGGSRPLMARECERRRSATDRCQRIA